MQSYIDSVYATFVQRVADGRKLSPAAVEAVARGHVWSGRQAMDRGLIDEFGSFQDAVERAKTRAQLRPGQEINLVTFGSPKQFINLSAILGTRATAFDQMGQLAAHAGRRHRGGPGSPSRFGTSPVPSGAAAQVEVGAMRPQAQTWEIDWIWPGSCASV